MTLLSLGRSTNAQPPSCTLICRHLANLGHALAGQSAATQCTYQDRSELGRTHLGGGSMKGLPERVTFALLRLETVRNALKGFASPLFDA